jgi:hypothetical protein
MLGLFIIVIIIVLLVLLGCFQYVFYVGGLN